MKKSKRYLNLLLEPVCMVLSCCHVYSHYGVQFGVLGVKDKLFPHWLLLYLNSLLGLSYELDYL